MAPGVEVAPEALGDVRFAHLAELCGLADADHALGKVVRLWAACRSTRSRVLPDAIIDKVLGKGGAAKLVESKLGDRQLEGGVYVRGSKDRIRWPEKDRSAAERKDTQRGASWTDEEKAAAGRVLAKLSERSGYQYGAASAYHVQPIVRLLRDGQSERDLQRVVWHRCLEWKDDPKMEPYLRPKTLFGPENFATYLPQANAAVESAQRDKDERDRGATPAPHFGGGE